MQFTGHLLDLKPASMHCECISEWLFDAFIG